MNQVLNAAIHFVGTGIVMYMGLSVGILMGRTREMRKYTSEMILQEIKRTHSTIKDFPHRCTWRCQMCYEERIDALIGVAKYRDDSGVMEVNIKYCRDKASCIAKANSIDLWYGEKVYPLVSP